MGKRKSLFSVGCQNLPSKGHDRAVKLFGPDDNTIGIVVADGLGSLECAKASSDFIALAMQEAVKVIDSKSNESITSSFLHIKEELIKYAKSESSNDSLDNKEKYGTTAILALETAEEFICAYVGNGSIWHLRGSLFRHHGNRLIPWNAVNVLNPHTQLENGKEALYRYFGTRPEIGCEPTIVRISKSASDSDIILITTDGITSNDQSSVGKVSSGVWVNVDDQMLKFFDYLRAFLENNVQSQDGLDSFISTFLKDLFESNMLNDDASIGIIISNMDGDGN